ncbi:TetR/AcrR family transcriptional regulator [Leucobacter allii]|uniref:TetR/AcrR family transcriptional regulator n=1 Tax=Leucobacter allii TaxID=2932247 RepID=UPI001FD00EBE|nr:TetR/AcrR family transcriptional regulator [Leucobacter allii]UOR02441.1 TetR/AcrR family transcriptional regulator [Leucobacter allii]
MTKIDRERIVDTALEVVATDGESGLSMRPLAARLGVTPMALYRYFPDRDALLLALVDCVSEEIRLPEPAVAPRERAVALALCLHDFLVEHPWMIRLISTGRLTSPAGLRFPEGFLGCARGAGLDDAMAFVFYRTMFASVLGQATMTAARAQTGIQTAPEPRASAEATPAVAALASRWPELDALATPAAVFGSVADLLAVR